MHTTWMVLFCLLALVAGGCSTQALGTTTAAAPAPATNGGAWSTGSITSAPASVPCGQVCAPTPPVQTACAPTVGPVGRPPAGAPTGSMRPGEVWCSYFEPPVYETNTQVIQKGTARWEWRRTTECDVPGVAGQAATPVAAGAPGQARPGEVWCYVKVPPEEETRTTRVLKSPGRWSWRRTVDCEVPQAQP